MSRASLVVGTVVIALAIYGAIPFSRTTETVTLWCDVPDTFWGEAGLEMEAATACGVTEAETTTRAQVFGAVRRQSVDEITAAGPASDFLRDLRDGGGRGLTAEEVAGCLPDMSLTVARRGGVLPNRPSPDREGHIRVSCVFAR